MVVCCKQKTAYEMRIRDWSSDVCSSDLVADQADRRAGGQRAEVDVEHVGVDEGEFAVRARGGGERLQQVAVEFDRRERAVALEQREGHRALAGAALDQPVAGLRVDGVDDPVDHAALVQEVLAEGFLRRRAEAVACVPDHARTPTGGVATAPLYRAPRRGPA